MEQLARHAGDIGISEYGFRTLSFVSFVSVVVELGPLQESLAAAVAGQSRGDATKGGAVVPLASRNKNVGMQRVPSMRNRQSTAEYLKQNDAIPLALRTIVGLLSKRDDLEHVASALSSVLQCIGNLMHNEMDDKIKLATWSHNVKVFHKSGDYSHTEEASLVGSLIHVGKEANLKMGQLREKIRLECISRDDEHRQRHELSVQEYYLEKARGQGRASGNTEVAGTKTMEDRSVRREANMTTMVLLLSIMEVTK